MRKLLASAMTAILLATGLPARGEEAAVYEAPVAAPAKSAKLIWRPATGTSVSGFWFSDTQLVKIDQRLRGCEDQLAIELFDRKVAEAKVAMPVWIWVASGLAVGLVAGYTTHYVVTK
jgi:hypothetical protein